jgi:hypothetical protein
MDLQRPPGFLTLHDCTNPTRPRTKKPSQNETILVESSRILAVFSVYRTLSQREHGSNELFPCVDCQAVLLILWIIRESSVVGGWT